MLVPRIKSATVLASSFGHRELRRPLGTIGNRQADKAKLKKPVPEALLQHFDPLTKNLSNSQPSVDQLDSISRFCFVAGFSVKYLIRSVTPRRN